MFLVTYFLSLLGDHLVTSGAVRYRLVTLNLSTFVSKFESFSALGYLPATDVFAFPVVQVELLSTSGDLLMACFVAEVESFATCLDVLRADVFSVLMDEFEAHLLANEGGLLTYRFLRVRPNQLKWLEAVRNLLLTDGMVQFESLLAPIELLRASFLSVFPAKVICFGTMMENL